MFEVDSVHSACDLIIHGHSSVAVTTPRTVRAATRISPGVTTGRQRCIHQPLVLSGSTILKDHQTPDPSALSACVIFLFSVLCTRFSLREIPCRPIYIHHKLASARTSRQPVVTVCPESTVLIVSSTDSRPPCRRLPHFCCWLSLGPGSETKTERDGIKLDSPLARSGTPSYILRRTLRRRRAFLRHSHQRLPAYNVSITYSPRSARLPSSPLMPIDV